jgi:hypothetical protein
MADILDNCKLDLMFNLLIISCLLVFIVSVLHKAMYTAH